MNRNEETPHWFYLKAMRFGGGHLEFFAGERKPMTLTEWFTFIWNADVFYGEIPFLKTLVLVNLLFCILLILL